MCALLLTYFAVKEDVDKKHKGGGIALLDKEIEANPRKLDKINRRHY
jgi:hypothetical protein